jgi:GNAT superfamily N-acetyltransferase
MVMELMIRDVVARDFDQVFGLLKQLWSYKELDYEDMKKVFEHKLQAPDHFFIAALYGPQIVGFCSLTVKHNLWIQGFLGNVDEMVVEESYRGMGIGKQLMQRITTIALEKNCKRLELESSFHREEAHTFYEELGFEKRAYLFSKEI